MANNSPALALGFGICIGLLVGFFVGSTLANPTADADTGADPQPDVEQLNSHYTRTIIEEDGVVCYAYLGDDGAVDCLPLNRTSATSTGGDGR